MGKWNFHTSWGTDILKKDRQPLWEAVLHNPLELSICPSSCLQLENGGPGGLSQMSRPRLDQAFILFSALFTTIPDQISPWDPVPVSIC